MRWHRKKLRAGGRRWSGKLPSYASSCHQRRTLPHQPRVTILHLHIYEAESNTTMCKKFWYTFITRLLAHTFVGFFLHLSSSHFLFMYDFSGSKTQAQSHLLYLDCFVSDQWVFPSSWDILYLGDAGVCVVIAWHTSQKSWIFGAACGWILHSLSVRWRGWTLGQFLNLEVTAKTSYDWESRMEIIEAVTFLMWRRCTTSITSLMEWTTAVSFAHKTPWIAVCHLICKDSMERKKKILTAQHKRKKESFFV